jgi:amino acid adenylation domain-containing protein
MNKWQSTELDLGYPLSRQQLLLATEDRSKLRSFWFELPLNQNVETIKHTLLSLMHSHQALTTYFAKPAGFDVIRQQVQSPRLIVEEQQHSLETDLTVKQKQEFELLAHRQFDQDMPHLLVWCWQTKNALVLQLIAPALMLDHYSAYNMYTQLLKGNECIAVASNQEQDETMQYQEYLAWINELQDDEDASDAKQFWQGLSLDGMENVRLTEQNQISQTLSVNSAINHKHVFIEVPEVIQNKLTELSVTLNCSSKDIVVNVWVVLLSKLSSNDEFKLDYYHDCRHDYEEFKNALGCFTQPLPIPFYHIFDNDLAGACQGFAQLFEEVKENQEYIVSLSEIASVYCNAGYVWRKQNKLSDMYCTSAAGDNELLLEYVEVEQGNGQFTLFYSGNRYQQQSMKRALEHFYNLLITMLDAPESKVSALSPLLPDEQSGSFVAKSAHFSIATNQQQETNIVDLFKQQAKEFPNNLAIKSNKDAITYQELDRLTDQYARAFQAMGAKPDTIIALCLPRTVECLVSLLSVLKSGAAYLPLDPEQPKTRLQQIIDDANPIILITELTNLAANQCCSLGQLNDEKRHQSISSYDIKPDHLAYVLYTSGSTGVPKGVQVEHQQIAHYSQSIIEQLTLPKESHYGQISSLMADLGNTMLFPAWLTGSCVHLLDKTEVNDGNELAKYINNSPLDCLKIVPSHLEALLASGQDILPNKVLVLGGEKIQSSLIKLLNDLSPSCKIFNHYGPTETTVGVMIGEVDLDTGSSTLSETIGSNQVLILDQNNKPVISGQCGELYVTGPNVTRGYLNDIARTNEVYLHITNPFLTKNTMRYYKTGDLALSHADGSVSILGRNDQQIKIRGFRLDLNEIQQLLLSYQDIAQANLQTSGEGENKQLIAFVVLIKGAELEVKVMLNYLVQHLPNYMVPSHVFSVKQFPLNRNGKIDSHQLLALAKQQQQQVVVEPSNKLECQLLVIWQDVLKLKKICITADFFDIGGHSLAAIKVVANARKLLAIELPTDLLFHYKSITDIAHYIKTQYQMSDLSHSDSPRLVFLNEKAKTNEIDSNEPCLILMHSLAGHFNYHRNFINNIGNEQALFGLTPNIDLLFENEHPQIDLISDDYIEQLLPLKNQSLTLIGWSLGAKQMMLMVKRMQSLGFKVTSLALIDFDPAQQLMLEDSAQQLTSDFHDYLTIENLELSSEKIAQLTSELNGSYEDAMDALLSHPDINSLIGPNIDIKDLKQRFMMRWKIKHMLYNTIMPMVDLPIWFWYGTGHKSSPEIWQKFSSLPLQSWYLNADHYEILHQAELSEQLIKNIVKTNALVTC